MFLIKIIILIIKTLGVLISAICENTLLVSSSKNDRNHNQNAAVILYVLVICSCSAVTLKINKINGE